MQFPLFGNDTWLEQRLAEIESSRNLPIEKKYDSLKVYLKIKAKQEELARPMTYEQQEVYEKVQDLFITTPGHAEYYAIKLADARKAAADTFESNYLKTYREAGEMLSHLPSVETIKVLGRLLENDTDYVDSKMTHKEMSDLFFKYMNEGKNSPLFTNNSSALSISVLNKLGVRGLPSSNLGRYVMMDDYRNTFLKWWDEVKSGQRTFSFVGQKIEYRFKPDGTWATIPIANPLDDGPQPIPSKPEAIRPEQKHPPSPPALPPTAPSFSVSWWLIVCSILALVIAALLLKLAKFHES